MVYRPCLLALPMTSRGAGLGLFCFSIGITPVRTGCAKPVISLLFCSMTGVEKVEVWSIVGPIFHKVIPVK